MRKVTQPKNQIGPLGVGWAKFLDQILDLGNTKDIRKFQTFGLSSLKRATSWPLNYEKKVEWLKTLY